MALGSGCATKSTARQTNAHRYMHSHVHRLIIQGTCSPGDLGFLQGGSKEWVAASIVGCVGFHSWQTRARKGAHFTGVKYSFTSARAQVWCKAHFSTSLGMNGPLVPLSCGHRCSGSPAHLPLHSPLDYTHRQSDFGHWWLCVWGHSRATSPQVALVYGNTVTGNDDPRTVLGPWERSEGVNTWALLPLG